MTTINLHQDSSETGLRNKSEKATDKGLYASVGIIVITLLVFGGMKFFNIKLMSDMEVADAQIKEAKDSFARERVNAVVDFQQRLDAIDKNMESQEDANAILQEVAKATISGTRITSYECEKKNLVIEMSTDNFFTIAKQVLSFKKSKSFSDVSVSEIQREEEEITFKLKMNAIF